MVVTVKMGDEKKAKLEKFLATLLVREGVKVSFQEALGLLVDFGLEREEDFIKKLKRFPPLDKDPAWKMLNQPKSWGIKDSSKRVDEYLYGR